MIRMLNAENADAIPIIAMTMDVTGREIKKCLDSGMNGYIAKPLAAEDVLAKMLKHVKGG
jgi:CheY-like chemotaxis protein